MFVVPVGSEWKQWISYKQLCLLCYQVFAFGLNNYCQAGVTGMWGVPEPREIYSGEGKLKINDLDT